MENEAKETILHIIVAEKHETPGNKFNKIQSVGASLGTLEGWLLTVSGSSPGSGLGSCNPSHFSGTAYFNLCNYIYLASSRHEL